MSDDLRAAAVKLDSTIDPTAWDCAIRLRAHADTIERIERDMRECDVYVMPWFPRELADALNGETK